MSEMPEPFVGTKDQYIALFADTPMGRRMEIEVMVYGAHDYKGLGTVLIVLTKDNGLPFFDFERAAMLEVLRDNTPINTEVTLAFGEPVR